MLNVADKILRRTKTEHPTAFVLGASSVNGLSFVRSLGRKGIPVTAIGSAGSPAMKSRYCIAVDDREFVSEETALLSFLEDVGRRLPVKGVLIPTNDPSVLFVSRSSSVLSQYFEFVVSDVSTLEAITDKIAQYKHAVSVGVPVPQSYYPNSESEIEILSGSLSYPCILKPAISYIWRRYRARERIDKWPKIAEVHGPDELVQAYSEMAKSGVSPIVQEKIEGDDDQIYAVLAYFDRESVPLGVFTMRKLRQWPVGAGDGSYVVSVDEPSVTEIALNLLKSFGYNGLAGVEFKRDGRDGVFKLMEINARSQSQEGLAVDCGVDFPYIAYEDSLARSVSPVTSHRTGVTWVSLSWDFRSYRQNRAAKQLSTLTWVNQLRTSGSHAYFAWDDPKPFIYSSLGLAKDLIYRRSG